MCVIPMSMPALFGTVTWQTGIIVIETLIIVVLAVLSLWLYQALRKANKNCDELLTLSKDMEAATKVKGKFLLSMSHEIRTAMDALTSFIEVLSQRSQQGGSDEQNEEADGIFSIIKKNNREINTIINDVFDYIKIDANLLEIESVPVSIKQVIHDVCHEEKQNVAARNLDLSVKYRGVIPPTILSDPVRIRQILAHFISNAVKFTEKGTITVLCEVLDQGAVPVGETAVKGKNTFSASSTQIKISVTDTGVGISPRYLQELFKPYRHEDAPLLRPKHSAGLGLNIAMRLATLLDGTITVESTPGLGSTFSLLMNAYVSEGTPPLLSGHNNAATPPDAGSRVYAGLDIRPPKKKIEEPENSNQPLKNTRILVVEDMAINQVVVATLLQEAGAQVELADNGAMGIQKVMLDMDNGLVFDAILMDMRMPVMDGYEATAYLRKYDYRRPIIAVTALDSACDREKAFEAGCDDYIVKPIDNQALIEVIKKYTAKG